MTIRVQADIPIPIGNSRRGKPPLYPFATMAVGESFWLPMPDGLKAMAAAQKWRVRHQKWDHVTRRVDGGVRIWRTA